MTKAMLTPKYDTTSVIETLEKKQTKTNEYYDQNTDHLSDLLPNQEILMQIDTRNWTPTKVIKESDSPESYQVQTLDGNQYRRNRIHLKRMRTPTSNTRWKPISEEQDTSETNEDTNET
ncbi:hypothetical protein QE152_g1215 [Popillia japonica]|uniref:Uncharacterized protein n=1 Tax=Popillia japonica TaxID=7064 RepID=A0AAW1N7I3_POPJA